MSRSAPATQPTRPSPLERHRDLAGVRGRARELARVVQRPGALGAEADAVRRAARASTAGSTLAARPPPADGLTMQRRTSRSQARDILRRTRSASVVGDRDDRRAAGPARPRPPRASSTPVSTTAASSPAACAPATSASSRSPTTSARGPSPPSAVQRRAEELRLGLADAHGRRAGRRLERRDDRAGARPGAVGHRERARRGRRTSSAAPRSDGLGRARAARRSRSLVCRRRRRRRRAREVGAVEDPQPGVVDVAVDRRGADDVGGAPAAASRRARAAARRRPSRPPRSEAWNAQAPQLADELLAAERGRRW